MGSNYGWVFTAYGVAGIAGPLLAGYFKDAAQGSGQPVVWMVPFIIAGAACLLGAAIMALTGQPRRNLPEPAPTVAGAAQRAMT